MLKHLIPMEEQIPRRIHKMEGRRIAPTNQITTKYVSKTSSRSDEEEARMKKAHLS